MAAELCEACGMNPPTVHYVEVVGGEKRTRAVCDACLSDKGFVIDPGVIQQAADHLVEHMQELLAQAKCQEQMAEVRSVAAARPRCGRGGG